MKSGTNIKVGDSKIFIPSYIQNYSLNVEYDKVEIKAIDNPITVVYTQKNTATTAISEFENIVSVNEGIESNLQIRQISGTDTYLDVKRESYFGSAKTTVSVFFSFIKMPIFPKQWILTKIIIKLK